MVNLEQAFEAQNLGHFDKAILLFEKVLSNHPTHAIALYSVGLCYATQQAWPKALTFIERAVQQEPHNPLFHQQLARLYARQSKLDWAHRHYEQALRLDPHYAEAHNNYGALLYREGKTTMALTHFQKALERMPDYADAHANSGHCYVLLHQPQQAIAHYKQALALHPQAPAVIHNLGMVLVQAGRFEEAALYLAQALEHDPNHAELWFHQGLVQCQSGETADALASYETAFRCDPQHSRAAHNIATLYLQQHQPSEAALWYSRAQSLDPHNTTAAYMLKALQGESPPEALRQAYVKELFDHYAPSYTHHVTHILDYQVPQHLRRLLDPFTDRLPLHPLALDYGCGTGLMAPYLSDLIAKLIGVDLSPAMLAQARQQGGYHTLIEAEGISALKQYPHQLHLITAADVLVYQGPLEPFFQAAAESLAPQGLLAFNLETTLDPTDPKGTPYQLQSTGRFNHEIDYIKQACHQADLEILAQEYCNLRKDQDHWRQGWVFICSGVSSRE